MKTILSLALGGFAGKILGLFREILLAAVYGLTAPVVAYRIAITAVFLPLNLSINEIIGAIILKPTNIRMQKNTANVAEYVWHTLLAIIIFSSILGGLIAIATPFWINALATGLNPETKTLCINMTYVLVIGSPFIVAGSFLSSIGIQFGLTSIQNSRAGIENIGVISGSALSYYSGNPIFIPIGFLFSEAVFVIASTIFHKKNRTLKITRVSLKFCMVIFKELAKESKFLIFVPIAINIPIFFHRSIATLMGESIVASVDFARNIIDTAVVLISTPVAMAILPRVSQNPDPATKEKIFRLCKLLLITSVIGSAYLFWNANFMVKIFYGRGNFGTEEINLTANFLTGFSIALPILIISPVALSYLYATSSKIIILILTIVGSLLGIATLLTLHNILGYFVFPIALALQSIPFIIYAAIHLLKNQSWKKFLLSLIMVSALAFTICMGLAKSLFYSTWINSIALISMAMLLFSYLILDSDIRAQTISKLLKQNEN